MIDIWRDYFFGSTHLLLIVELHLIRKKTNNKSLIFNVWELAYYFIRFVSNLHFRIFWGLPNFCKNRASIWTKKKLLESQIVGVWYDNGSKKQQKKICFFYVTWHTYIYTYFFFPYQIKIIDEIKAKSLFVTNTTHVCKYMGITSTKWAHFSLK